MATRTASRRPTQRPRSKTEDAALTALEGWARFTFARDTHPTRARIPHVATNWLVTIALALVAAQAPHLWRPVAAIAAAGLVYTIVRAARWLPNTKKTLAALYAATTPSCGHPRPTSTRPVDPATRIKVTRWANPKTPAAFTIATEPTSTAAKPATRWQVEKDIAAFVADTDHDAVFTHAPGKITVERVTRDDPRVLQKSAQTWIDSVITQLFPAKRGPGTEVEVSYDFTDAPNPTTPSAVTITFGAYDVSARDFRDRVERGFDAQVTRPGTDWLHDWTQPGALVITAIPADSAAATRKHVARKVSDVAINALTRATGAKNTAEATVDVTHWVPETNQTRPNTPTRIHVDLGTGDYSSTTKQRTAEAAIDQALEAEWDDRIWLHDWTYGTSPSLDLTAVPKKDVRALQKAELRRMQAVVDAKFKVARDGIPPEVTVHDWDEAKPARLTVTFGTVDVQKADTRREFQGHFDNLTDANDWRYTWRFQDGAVDVEAVPALPRYIRFPDEGTPDCAAWHESFRDAKIFLGPAKGGYRTEVNMAKVPHTLYGGNTGAGKSVALMLTLYGALMNPDVCELIVVDPKVTDFTWTAGYPNVLTYAPTDARVAEEQIHAAVKQAFDAMTDRQNLLNRYGAKNLDVLRRLAREGKVDIPVEDIPKRLILFFDELGAAFTPSKDPDLKALQDEARTWMAKIMQLGRAMQVNVVGAAQKPSAENMGTQMRDLMGNRIGIGELNTQTSIQVLGNTLCAEMDPGSPKGRGWFVNEEGKELLFQCFYLPEMDEPDPLDPSVRLRGVQERVADMLTARGWQQVEVPQTFTAPKADGTVETYTKMVTDWVHPGRIDQP